MHGGSVARAGKVLRPRWYAQRTLRPPNCSPETPFRELRSHGLPKDSRRRVAGPAAWEIACGTPLPLPHDFMFPSCKSATGFGIAGEMIYSTFKDLYSSIPFEMESDFSLEESMQRLVESLNHGERGGDGRTRRKGPGNAQRAPMFTTPDRSHRSCTPVRNLAWEFNSQAWWVQECNSWTSGDYGVLRVLQQATGSLPTCSDGCFLFGDWGDRASVSADTNVPEGCRVSSASRRKGAERRQ